MKSLVKSKQDLIKNNYLSSKTNHAICIDISNLGQNGEIFVGIDLAARLVVMHCYKKEPLNVEDVTQTLDMALKHREFLPNIKIIHSDRGSIFRNITFQNFLEEKNIEISRGSAKGHTNQVMERTFRTLKDLIREQMDKHWREKIKGDIKDKKQKEKNAYDPIKRMAFNYQQMKEFVDNALNTYNNRPHGALGKMTPFHMEKALYQHYNEESENLKDIPPLAKNDQSENALQIRNVKEQAIISFIAKAKVLPSNERDLRFYQYLEEGFERVIDTVKDQQVFIIETITKQLKDANKQRKDMYELNLQLQQQIHTLQVESEKQRIAREDTEQKKEKRKNAVKAPIRETIEEEEFFFILGLIKYNNFVGARKKSAIILMYLTGLRVSNLLVLTVRHAMQLLEQGETTIPLIKRGPQRFSIKLSDQGKALIKKFHTLFMTLMVNKETSMPLFTTQVCFEKPIDRTSLDKEINTVLTKASEKLGKHIRTHSFRATIITNYLHETPIDVVKDVVGHKDIKTTALYKRSKVDKHQIRLVLKNLDKVMFKSKEESLTKETNKEDQENQNS